MLQAKIIIHAHSLSLCRLNHLIYTSQVTERAALKTLILVGLHLICPSINSERAFFCLWNIRRVKSLHSDEIILEAALLIYVTINP